MVPGKRNVPAFLAKLPGSPDPGGRGGCFNVVPAEIAGRHGFDVFKFDGSCAGYLAVGGDIRPLGRWFGGVGLTSFALADLDGDGAEELYFACSWGSGRPRSELGYHAFATGEEVPLAVSFAVDGLAFAVDDGVLSVHAATFAGPSPVDMETVLHGKRGEIVFENGRICFRETES